MARLRLRCGRPAERQESERKAGNTIVAINTAGNTGAEMQIELAGVINLTAGDFML
jgi:hypothetical protein